MDLSRAYQRRGGGRRVGRGGGGAPPAAMTGVQSFDSSNFFLSSANGIAGVGTGFWVATLFRIAAQSGSANRFMFRTISAASGWRLRTTTTHAALSFQAAGADTTFITSPAYTIQASDVGKIVMAVGVHDGSALKLYVNRALVGTSTAITGYAVPAASDNRIGDTFDNAAIFGAAGGHAVPALSDIQNFFDAVKAARAMVAMPGITTGRVWVSDRASTLTDKVSGTATATVTGALTTQRFSPLQWGW